jgi:hypothetical protein
MRGRRHHRSDRACRRETNAGSSWQNAPCPLAALAVAPRRAPGHSSRESQTVRLASGPTPPPMPTLRVPMPMLRVPMLRVPAPEPAPVLPRTQMQLPLLGSEASGAPPLHPRPLTLPKAAYQSETAAEPTDFTMLLSQPRANITLTFALAISGQALAASVQADTRIGPATRPKNGASLRGQPWPACCSLGGGDPVFHPLRCWGPSHQRVSDTIGGEVLSAARRGAE